MAAHYLVVIQLGACLDHPNALGQMSLDGDAGALIEERPRTRAPAGVEAGPLVLLGHLRIAQADALEVNLRLRGGGRRAQDCGQRTGLPLVDLACKSWHPRASVRPSPKM